MEKAFAPKQDKKKTVETHGGDLHQVQEPLPHGTRVSVGLPLFLQGGGFSSTAQGVIQRKSRNEDGVRDENEDQPVVHPNLAMGQPGDVYEQEADQVAERVVASPSPADIQHMHSPPGVQCSCDGCTSATPCQECEEEGGAVVQRKAEPGSTPGKLSDLDSRLHDLGPGHPLDPSTRAFFEPRFGHNFGGVRVHNDDTAGGMARSLGARAFTVGQNVVFAPGELSVGTAEGRRLLAHELTHVVQQNNARVTPDRLISDPADAAEREATGAGTHIQGTGPIVSHAVPSAMIHREPPSGTTATATQAAPTAVATPAPAATGETYVFEDVTLSENADQVRYEMERQVAKGGFGAADSFLGRLEYFCGPILEGAKQFKKDFDEDPSYISGGVPLQAEEFEQREKLKDKILPVVRQVVKPLNDDNRAFLTKFEGQARSIIAETLNQSEIRVKAEALKYGMTSEQLEKTEMISDGLGHATITTTYTKHGMADAPAGKGLAAAASVLAPRKDEIARLREEQRSHIHTIVSHVLVRTTYDPEYYVLGKTIEQKTREYDLLRGELEKQYPILATFAADTDSDRLKQLAKGPSPEAAAVLGGEIAEKLANINKVRSELKPGGEVKIWKLQRIVSATQAQMGIQPGSMQAKLVEETIQQVQSLEFWTNLVLGLLNLGLVLLAPVTGGLSLVGAAAISVGTAAVHLQEYLIEEAMAGTDFDKARAISQQDPSLFWLALDIVGAVVDVGAAGSALLKIFGEMAPLVKAAAAAKTVEEAKGALETAETAARVRGGEKLAQSVAGGVERMRGEVGTLESILGKGSKDLETLERAAKAGESELSKVGELGTGVDALGGGKVRVSKAGHVFGCTSPCTMLRERYAEALVRKPELLTELNEIESLAGKAAKEGDQAIAKQLEARARDLETELRKVPTLERAENIAQGVKTLSSKYPILQELGLETAAVERVLAKAPDVGHMKGQLLEELLASRARNVLAAGSEAEKGALVGERAAKAGALEFIEGHRITDAAGKQLSDGIIVIREGDKYRVLTVFESKAGRASSRGLKYAYKSIKDMTVDEFKELRLVAMEELREANPAKYKGLSSADMEKAFSKEIDAAMTEIPKSEAGQVGKDLERFMPNEGKDATTILIDGKPAEVTASRTETRIKGILPSDVRGEKIAAGFASEGLRFEAMNLNISQKALEALANDLAKVAIAAK